LAARLLGGLFLAGFGIALALAALEVGVRVMHLVPDRFWQPDALLGTWHIPGKRGWWTQEEHEFVVPVTISSQGLRDVEHTEAKPSDVVRVLVLGDSYIEALQVPLEQSFSRQLEAALNGQGGARRFEVVSMGVSGYGTASELLYYRKAGRAFAPDVVVLAFYPGNDVRNNSPTLEPTLTPVYGEDGALQRVVGSGKSSDPRGLLGRVQSYQYVRKLILTRSPRVANLLIGAGLMERGALREGPMVDGIPTDYWVYADPVPSDWENAWNHSEELIRTLRDETQRDQAHFAVMVVTARDYIYADSWAQIVAANPRMRDVKWNLEAPERRILAWCEAQGLSCLHLSEIFAQHRGDGQRLHWVYDGHWTAPGHALAARSMADFLRERKLLPAQ
jgi:hypothetical protein